MAETDRAERAFKKMRLHEEGLKAAKAELALILLGTGPRQSRAAPSEPANGSGGGEKRAATGARGLGDRGLPILKSIRNRSGSAKMREIILDVTGQEHPGDAEAKRLRGAVQLLKRNNYVTSAEHGVWSITESGTEVLNREEAGF